MSIFWSGTIVKIAPSHLEVCGITGQIGSIMLIDVKIKLIEAEIIAIEDKKIILMPYDGVYGLEIGMKVYYKNNFNFIFPSNKWLGRTLNGKAEPIDNLGEIEQGIKAYDVFAKPSLGISRARISKHLNTGIKVIDLFIPCSIGQRLAIFAGSGVGKSTLLGQLAYSDCDVIVVGLIGERGREVREFLEDILGDNLSKAIVIVETSDSSALMRRRAAYTTLTVAEYFRDQGKHVLCMIDSLTRVAFAQREIGLIAGENISSNGYPPSIYNVLSNILERAGPGVNTGFITGIFTVLVESDNLLNLEVDIVRSVLDGHIVLSRRLAERGHFPAIDPLKSLSRIPTLKPEEQLLVTEARKLIEIYTSDIEDLVRIGAYKKGGDALADKAVATWPKLEKFLQQNMHERYSIAESLKILKETLS